MMKFDEQKFRDTIDFEPHKGQKRVLECKKDEIAICAGRRWGKTFLCAYLVIREAAKNLIEMRQKKTEPITIWIVAPNYELTKKVFNQVVRWFVKLFPQYADKVSHRPPAHIYLPGGAKIECKSGENPSGMLGEGLDLVIMDEASRVKEVIYNSYLYPALQSNSGDFIAISTPTGKNWFFDFFQRLESSFHFTSKEGVAITQEKWEKAQQQLPKDIFDQEYRAIFKESAYSVFSKEDLDNCVGKPLQDSKPDHYYILGLDLAKMNDWTVITVVDRDTNNVVYWERYQKEPYDKNRMKVASVTERYNNARIVIDSQNVGGSFGDELRNMGFMVDDYSTAGRISKDLNKRGKKQQIIHKLQLFIENNNITLPNSPVLLDELESYAMEMTKSGRITYSAPQGIHDDCVDSLALAVWGLSNSRPKQKNKMKEELQKVNKQSFI